MAAQGMKGNSEEGKVKQSDAVFKDVEKQLKKKSAISEKLEEKSQKKAIERLQKLYEKMYQELDARQDITEAEKAQLKFDLQEELATRQANIDKELDTAKAKRAKATANAVNKLLGTSGDSATEIANAALDKLTKTLDDTMTRFLSDLAAIAYNLNGTSATFSSINDNLSNVLASTGIVKQEEVYKNLKTLVQEGIVYDAEQRAYLMTLSEDLGMNFNMQSASLNRLINLQRVDMSDNRMAIQASLKTFLNQNYMTSQYIKEGFENVSDALIEAQSLMDATSASALELTVQKWMGSLSSVGAATDTINSLADALGKLGSGDISALNGTEMQRLLVLGANRAGKSYGSLITEGLTSDTVDALMEGVTEVVNDMIGTSSNNAVKSELARVFGLNVSDVVAFLNLASIGAEGSLTNDINSALLSKTDEYIYATTKIANQLENFIYSWATNIASDDTRYLVYKGVEMVSEIAAAALDGTTATIGFLGNGVLIDLGTVARLAPIAWALTAFDLDNFGLFDNDASKIYLGLSSGSTTSIMAAGNLTGYNKGVGTSSSAVILNNDNTDIGKQAVTSATTKAGEIVETDEDSHDFDDLYNLLTNSYDDLTSTQFDKLATAIGASISDSLSGVGSTDLSTLESYLKTIRDDLRSVKNSSGSNYTTTNTNTNNSTVTAVQIDQDVTTYIQDALQIAALNSLNIYNLLVNWYQSNTNNKQYSTYKPSSQSTLLTNANYTTFSYSDKYNSWTGVTRGSGGTR